MDYNSLVLKCINKDFIFHISEEPWGISISIMEREGKALGRLYQYLDDRTVVYLDNLSVNEEVRRKGIGTKLQIIRENIGILLGSNISYLWVHKDTWMHEWYKRRGYEDDMDNESEENSIWMRKSLNS